VRVSTPTPAAGSGAVVTGGGGGLGRAIAAMLVARGHHVWIADVDVAAATRVADELGPRATAAPLDVTDATACRALASEVASGSGLAVWVNNAGILRTGPAWEHPDAEIAAMFAINTRGTVNGTSAALASMRSVGRGHVVNVVSLAGLVAAPGETVYSASKHAALAYSIGTDLDLRRTGWRHVRVSAVCPDGIWTPMLYDKVDDPEAALSWSGVLLQPDQVALVIGEVLRRPRPVVSIPRWRGGLARLYAASPRAAVVLAPVVLAQARRAQARFARSLRG
jgi:NAD(P)-dependent dehydrogenase (short-subunit alcohol dehydrogenase family)